MAKKINSWLKSVLPEHFAEKQAEFLQMEVFIKQFFKPEIHSQIQLMSCIGNKVVLAAKSPQVASYLKMQQNRLLDVMHQQLAKDYRILIKTNPSSSKKTKKRALPLVKRSSSAAITLQQTSQVIKDQSLKAALQRLAESIKEK